MPVLARLESVLALQIQDRPLGQTGMDRNAIIENQLVDMFAENNGFSEVLVKLDEPVTKGQKVAVQGDAFGEVIRGYIAEVDGCVAIIGIDPVREKDVDVVSILTNSEKCKDRGCEYAGFCYHAATRIIP